MTQGLYRDADSLLHRLDARVKLILVGALVICLFSSFSPVRLGFIAGVWLILAILARQAFSDAWRILKMLKWLLLFSLLLHLLFTPGRTLFGTGWLSLDGLVNGICVDLQILLAVLLSLLISSTTSPQALAGALAAMLSPLQLFKIPVKEVGAMLVLVLHFFPLIKSEIVALRLQNRQAGHGVLTRLRNWSEQLEMVLLRLLDQGDALAHAIVDGNSDLFTGPVSDHRTMGMLSLLVLLAGLSGIFLLWRV